MNFKPTVQIVRRIVAAAALTALLMAGSGLLPVTQSEEGAIAMSQEFATSDSMRDLPWIAVPNGNFWSG